MSRAASSLACASRWCGAGRWLPLIGLSTALVGCAALTNKPMEPTAASESALYMDAVNGLIRQGQFYAAIAHIEEDRRSYGDTPALRLLEADARRNLKQNKAAETLYQNVLRPAPGGPLAGKARHGLGLLYAPVDLKAALRELREASKLKPTDAAIRSDLGFALMRAGRFAEARIELATAHELAPDNIAARNNLLILLYVQNQPAAAQKLATAMQVDAGLLAQLRAQAQSFGKAKPRS